MKNNRSTKHLLSRDQKRQKSTELFFRGLMIEFLEFIGDQNAESHPVLDKIEELNDRWLKKVQTIKNHVHIETANAEFRKHIAKAIEGMPTVMQIAKAEDSPLRLPEAEKMSGPEIHDL
jgi:hypothetical protein